MPKSLRIHVLFVFSQVFYYQNGVREGDIERCEKDMKMKECEVIVSSWDMRMRGLGRNEECKFWGDN